MRKCQYCGSELTSGGCPRPDLHIPPVDALHIACTERDELRAELAAYKKAGIGDQETMEALKESDRQVSYPAANPNFYGTTLARALRSAWKALTDVQNRIGKCYCQPPGQDSGPMCDHCELAEEIIARKKAEDERDVAIRGRELSDAGYLALDGYHKSCGPVLLSMAKDARSYQDRAEAAEKERDEWKERHRQEEFRYAELCESLTKQK